jgi:hypothetical protein
MDKIELMWLTYYHTLKQLLRNSFGFDVQTFQVAEA